MSEEKQAVAGAEDHGEVVERRGLRISWAWVFPFLAAGAAAWLFWSQWKSRGPDIEIQFDDAPGLQAGKTPLIYRGVEAGKVTGVRLDADLNKVVVDVRLKAFAADLAQQGTVFWIDRPVISLEQTTGLDAIVQGNSLRARKGSGPPTRQFSGLDSPPLTPLEVPALVLRLRARGTPFLGRGTPVYYRGIVVGHVEDTVLGDDGSPFLQVVIDEQFKRTVHSNSRFWSVPATALRAGPGGVKFEILGLAALVQGGIAFDGFRESGEAVPNGTQFEIFPDERAARCSAPPIQISFDDGRGLLAGQTPVCYRGLPVGFVEKVALDLANGKVDVVARLEPGYEILEDAGTVFTLVRPRISLEGVSGLDTLITGVYIEGSPGQAGERAQRFAGRTISDEEWNRSEAERNGLEIRLRAREIPTLDEGAPVFYRGVVAGTVKEKALDGNRQPFLRVVIHKGFEQAVQRNARFWRSPATSVQAGPGVLKVDLAGLQALWQGGVQFDVFEPSAGAVVSGAEFELFANESAARSTSPPIRIAFENAQGLLEGQTQLRYRGIPVGVVEKITPSKTKVEVVARLETGYDFLRRETSSFVLVRPQISLDGISGLEALVSGVYIECVPGPRGRLAQSFVGSSREDLSQENEGDFRVVITASATSVTVGAPIYYRGIRAGQVEQKELSADGRGVQLVASIREPYNRLIRENTKFWDVSGLKASLGFFFIKVPTERLDSLIRGGIAFATPNNPDMGPAVSAGHEFVLNKDPRREWLRWSPTFPLQGNRQTRTGDRAKERARSK
jgi:paraquat-inducible protein B